MIPKYSYSNHRLWQKALTLTPLLGTLSLALLTLGRGEVSAQGLVETKIAHTGRQVYSLAINDNNWATWATGLTPTTMVYVWHDNTTTTLGLANRRNWNPQINNNNWVVWDAFRDSNQNSTDVFLWKATGNPITISGALDSAAEPTINNLNDIAFDGLLNGNTGSDIFWLGHDKNQVLDATAGDPDAESEERPRLNDSGILSWQRLVPASGGGSVNDLVWAKVSDLQTTFSYNQVSNNNDPNIRNGGINASGKLVWEQFSDAKQVFDVWQYDPVTHASTSLSTNLKGSSQQATVANDGTVAWHTDYPIVGAVLNHADMYWDMGAGYSLIPVTAPGRFDRPLAINNMGSVLYSSGDGTGTGFDLYLARRPDVSGIITLEECVKPENTVIRFEFRPKNGSPKFVLSTQIDHTGNFRLKAVPPGDYNVAIKGSKWLQRVVMVTPFGSDVTNLKVTLLSGDINNDNVCGLDDLGLLADAFDTKPGDALWNPAADLNCDGVVGLDDLGILANNFDVEGDK